MNGAEDARGAIMTKERRNKTIWKKENGGKKGNERKEKKRKKKEKEEKDAASRKIPTEV